MRQARVGRDGGFVELSRWAPVGLQVRLRSTGRMELVLVAISVWILSRTPLGMAMVERVRSGGRSGSGIERRLEELEVRLTSELEALREEVVELQERLDFAERALTAVRRSDALPGPQ